MGRQATFLKVRPNLNICGEYKVSRRINLYHQLLYTLEDTHLEGFFLEESILCAKSMQEESRHVWKGECDKHSAGLPETEGSVHTGKDRMHLRAVSCKTAAAVQASGRRAISGVQIETYGIVHPQTMKTIIVHAISLY